MAGRAINRHDQKERSENQTTTLVVVVGILQCKARHMDCTVLSMYNDNESNFVEKALARIAMAIIFLAFIVALKSFGLLS